MAATTISRSKRFAVRRNACVQTQCGNLWRALLVEVSLDGCRVGAVSGPELKIGDSVAMAIDGLAPLAARVGCVVNGSVGLRFVRPLHCRDLDSIITHCRRPEPDAAERQFAG